MLLTRAKSIRRTIGLTALIDVVFLLLVFFMLASTFLKFGTVTINAAGPSANMADLSKTVSIFVDEKGRATIDGAAVPPETLRDRLNALHTQGRDRVVVRVDEETTAGGLVSTLALVRRTQFKTVQVSR